MQKTKRMQKPDYPLQKIDAPLLESLRQLVRISIAEDLNYFHDLTTAALVPGGGSGQANIVARVAGAAAGFELIQTILEEFDCTIECELLIGDGDRFTPQTKLAILKGVTRDLLTCERTILNVLGKLCGIATLTQRFVSQVAGTKARVYDTRKTTPGWRRLEKYAVHCGGGHTHRMGLYDAVLIKDNHLAANATATGEPLDTFTAVQMAREYLVRASVPNHEQVIIEIEIDTFEQLQNALRAKADIVLLDNMNIQTLRRCVELRASMNSEAELEASGGVNLETIAGIAQTGVDRISVGALTHSAINLDLGLDWKI